MIKKSFQKKESITSPIQILEFRLFIAARFFITFSFHSIHVAVCWQILEITKSPLALGILGAVEFVPHFLFAFLGGYTADRFSRRKILLFCISGISVCSITLFGINLSFVTEPSTLSSTALLYIIYGVMAVVGVVRGFYAPAALSFMAHIVPQRLYPKSSAWNSAVWQTASMTGPALAGFIYAKAGPNSVYLVNTLLLGVSFFLMFWIRNKGIPKQKEKAEKITTGIKKGLQFIYKQKALSGALLLDLFAVLFGGAVALLPIFADTILRTGPAGLGLLRAAPAVGAFVTAVFLVNRPPLKKTGQTMLWAVGGFGMSMFLFAFSRDFYLSLFLLFLSGVFDSVSVIVRSIMIQILTPDNMRGRIAAVNFIFITSSNELGAFESGLTAQWIGTIRSVWIGGIITQIVVLGIASLFPELRKLELGRYKEKRPSEEQS